MSHESNELSEVVRKWIIPYTPGILTEKELDQFFSEGYVIKHGLFSKEELQPAIADIEKLVDNLANLLFKAGKIKDLCKDSGFYQRLILLEEQFPYASVLLIKTEIFPPAFWCTEWTSQTVVNRETNPWSRCGSTPRLEPAN